MKWGLFDTVQEKNGIVRDGTALQNLAHTHIQNPVFKYKSDIVIAVTEPIVNVMGMNLYSNLASFVTLDHNHWGQEQNRVNQTGPVRRPGLWPCYTVV